jgi:hypothetical protein
MKKVLPNTLTVSVTARDIARATQADCRRCPIALAANRTLRQLGFLNNPVSVLGDITVRTRRAGNMMDYYPLPMTAQVFIGLFDAVRPNDFEPMPFTFTTGQRGKVNE